MENNNAPRGRIIVFIVLPLFAGIFFNTREQESTDDG